jgi:arylsulfatase A
MKCIAMLAAGLVVAGGEMIPEIRAAAPVQKPNIVFILTDDQGWCDRGTPIDPAHPDSGRPELFRTPNIDRLFKSGMSFTNGYAPAPICTPTRRSIQFGMGAARTGWEFQSDFDPAGHDSLAQMIKKTAPEYVCAHFGKWGEYMIGRKRGPVGGRYDDPRGSPEALGYDVTDGWNGNEHGDNGDSHGKSDLVADNEDPKRMFSLTRKGIDFMKEQVKAGKPFYLQISHYAIHRTPYARQETIDKYKGKADPKGGEYAMSIPPMLEDLDTAIGQLMDAMKEMGLEKNTYVFFGADNGGPLSKGADPSLPPRNHPLKDGKHSIWEGGVRVPVMASGPGVPAGTVCSVPVVLYDLYATVHELIGGKGALPADIDAVSMVDVWLKGDQGSLKRKEPGLVFHYPSPKGSYSALRIGDDKALAFWKDADWGIDHVELYDLAKDIGEEHNLAAANPEKAQRMAGQLTDFLKSVNAEKPVFGEPRKKGGRKVAPARDAVE